MAVEEDRSAGAAPVAARTREHRRGSRSCPWGSRASAKKDQRRQPPPPGPAAPQIFRRPLLPPAALHRKHRHPTGWQPPWQPAKARLSSRPDSARWACAPSRPRSEASKPRPRTSRLPLAPIRWRLQALLWRAARHTRAAALARTRAAAAAGPGRSSSGWPGGNPSRPQTRILPRRRRGAQGPSAARASEDRPAADLGAREVSGCPAASREPRGRIRLPREMLRRRPGDTRRRRAAKRRTAETARSPRRSGRGPWRPLRAPPAAGPGPRKLGLRPPLPSLPQ